MTLYPIETGNFKLDGGAMFGVVPKSLWQRTNPADSNNMIDMAARCLLIETGNRLILIDTGMGQKQSDKFFGYYYPFGDFSLNKSLAKYGFHSDDITDVFLTHLHFDHVGGCIAYNKDRTGYQSVFKNAVFWTNQDHWNWATHPNAREKASFLSENIWPLQQNNQLKFLSQTDSPANLEPLITNTDNEKFDLSVRGSSAPEALNFIKSSQMGFGVYYVDGHTDKQMLPCIDYKGEKLVFVADLLPTVGHIPVPYVMGYDTRPLLTMQEKASFLNEAADRGYYLFLEHDAHTEICTVKHTEKGVRLNKSFTFNELFG